MTRYNHTIDPMLLNLADLSRIRQHVKSAAASKQAVVRMRVVDVERLLTEHGDMRRDLDEARRIARDMRRLIEPLLEASGYCKEG